MVIEHDNIIYMSDLPNIGGTSTYVLELCKRYKDKDIAVVYKTCQYEMVLKVKKYCRVYQLHPEDRIKCKVMVINHDSSVCEQVDEGYIYMTLHADYSNKIYNGGHPNFVDRIDEYISITKGIQQWLKKECGKESQLIYNPLTIEDKKPIVLMSATRMSKEKGRDRTEALAKALNNAGVNYVWYIFTPSRDAIENPNIIYMTERMDLERFMYQADYVVQLSDSEGLSYTINEALYRNIPVIVTPLPYLDEIGVKDGENAYILEFDCSNVDEVAKKITNKPKFKFKHLPDSYDDIFTDKKSHYTKDLTTMVEVECVYPLGFYDMDVGVWRKKHEKWLTDKVRAYDLLQNPKNIIRIIEEEKENAKIKVNSWRTCRFRRKDNG